MSNKRGKFQSTYENLKSCLVELYFSKPYEVINKNDGKFKTEIQDDDFVILIEFSFQANIVNIKVSSDLIFKMSSMVPFYQLLNEINLKLMDIGHFSINEADSDVLLQAAVDLTDQNFDREQVLITIYRISLQGLELFNLLRKMFDGDQCPFHLLKNYIEAMIELRVNDTTIH